LARQADSREVIFHMMRAFEQAGLKARIIPLNISQSGASVLENHSDDGPVDFPTAENDFMR